VRYKARAPLRIDLAGGWTDVPEYAAQHGGAVLTAAISQYVTGTITRPNEADSVSSRRTSRSEVSYSLDLPSGAGLGASAAQTLLWVTLVKTTIANISSRAELAEIACQVGGLLGIVGGKQDEYASALGGIQYLTFGETVQAERIDLPPPLESELRSRLVLVYTGAPRLSGSIHEQVWAQYRAGSASVGEALASLTRIAGEMRDALVAGNLEVVGELMSENWTQQKALHPSVTTPNLDAIIDLAARHGAIGHKACGAGGGGCAVFLSAAGAQAGLRKALHEHRVRIIDFEFDTYGVYLTKD
jgi:D-glycero-alpha-D-manno-heptose-7-phosphate kinase